MSSSNQNTLAGKRAPAANPMSELTGASETKTSGSGSVHWLVCA